jgi:hypothetical protein
MSSAVLVDANGFGLLSQVSALAQVGPERGEVSLG